MAKVEGGEGGALPTYFVALPDHIIHTNDGDLLAPELATGRRCCRCCWHPPTAPPHPLTPTPAPHTHARTHAPLAAGDAVRYHSPTGAVVDAVVSETDYSTWPPTYLIRLADGSYKDTTGGVGWGLGWVGACGGWGGVGGKVTRGLQDATSAAAAAAAAAPAAAVGIGVVCQEGGSV